MKEGLVPCLDLQLFFGRVISDACERLEKSDEKVATFEFAGTFSLERTKCHIPDPNKRMIKIFIDWPRPNFCSGVSNFWGRWLEKSLSGLV